MMSAMTRETCETRSRPAARERQTFILFAALHAFFAKAVFREWPVVGNEMSAIKRKTRKEQAQIDRTSF